MGLRYLVLLADAQGPTGSSLRFRSLQWAFLLHGLHEEALRRDQRLDSLCAKQSDHMPCSRALPLHANYFRSSFLRQAMMNASVISSVLYVARTDPPRKETLSRRLSDHQLLCTPQPVLAVV